MHTFVHGETDTGFHHNSDMSGDVVITSPNIRGGIVVPAEALLAFVAQWAAAERIARLEQAGAKQILLGFDVSDGR